MYSVVQPIVRLDDGLIIGYEALARIDAEPFQGPAWWLERSDTDGTREELELEFLRSAARLGPPPGDALLFVNASPAALSNPALFDVREDLPERLVLEITEQAAVDDYTRLHADLSRWTRSRARFAIDDTGAGYSSLRHVVELSPDFLKLDRTLVSGIDRDTQRNALVRALVAFAREVGTSVVAEGIETAAELAVLVEAGVTIGQGYLLGRPGPPWPELAPDITPLGTAFDVGRDADLRQDLARARTAAAACEAVTAHLFRFGQLMPSLYLEQNGRLRCVSQRGLWQVLDGLSADGGITGLVWSTGRAVEVDDVASHPGYLEAVPGVVAEACVPVRLAGRIIGALNVDSLSPLAPGLTRHLGDCAALLAKRLGSLGWRSDDSPWQRAVQGSVAVSEATADRDAAQRILASVLNAAGMDSGAMIRVDRDQARMESSIGPLRPTLSDLDVASLQAICKLVDGLSSCYTGSEATGLPYLGSETLRAGGARAVVLLPLRTSNTSLGAMVLAHSRPMRLARELVEPLELLAAQAAATLQAVDLVGQLRHQANRDGLTGLLNRSAWEDALRQSASTGGAVLVADLDHFKQVNDQFGHPSADAALQSLARELDSEFGEVDFFRMGGDEFTCLLPLADRNEADSFAQAVLTLSARVLAPWGTTMSIGVAVATADEPLTATLVRADLALLGVKRNTRGRLAFAT